jgi:hypothetical protein
MTSVRLELQACYSITFERHTVPARVEHYACAHPHTETVSKSSLWHVMATGKATCDVQVYTFYSHHLGNDPKELCSRDKVVSKLFYTVSTVIMQMVHVTVRHCK